MKQMQVLLKSDRITGALHEDLCILMIMSLWMPLRKRNASDRVLEKIKTHIMVSSIFLKIVPFMR